MRQTVRKEGDTLLRVAKIALGVLYQCSSIFGRILIKALGTRRLKILVIGLLNDEETRNKITNAGMASMLIQLDAIAKQLLDPDYLNPQIAAEWGEFVRGFADDPTPDEIPDFFQYVRESRVLDIAGFQLPTAGAVIALAERYPDFLDAPEVVAAHQLMTVCDPERAGWSDYYMARWFVLRDDETASEILRRSRLEGVVGQTARWMVGSVAAQSPKFLETMTRLGWNPMDAEYVTIEKGKPVFHPVREQTQ